jgi:queuine tRNA-ribosyltransferase
MRPKSFRYKNGRLKLPVFFPDATRAVVKSIDTADIESSKTPGILVNTFHLWQELGTDVLKKFGGVREFMNYPGAVISDSGGFQVMSVIKSKNIKGKITDEGAVFYPSKNKKKILTPEKSIEFQMALRSDMVVALDDFTDPASGYNEAKISVERTIDWAKRSKAEFEKICKGRTLVNRPYILGVVQGGYFQDLREYCTKELVKIGFDGLGYGGWPLTGEGTFDYESAKSIANNTPPDYFLYGLGVGKPEEVYGCAKMGFNIFDCVLPTRDARHKRLYVYNFDSIDEIDLNVQKFYPSSTSEKNSKNVSSRSFYSFYNPTQEKYYKDDSPVSIACDCLLCKKYSKAYLAHLFRIGDFTAGRLATIHNLRFYSILMDKIGKTIDI